MTYSASSYPYDTVVRITDTIGSQSWQGSGVLISPDEVLTASHVVYIQGVGTANDIVVTPGYSDGSSPYGSADGTYIHYFPIDDANRSITNQQSQNDYAVIHLASPFTSAGFMGLESNFAGGAVNITGYPGSAGGAQVNSSQTVSRDPNYTLLDGTALGEGSSGGPVWINAAGGPHVVGVVSSESDVSTTGYNALITTAAFNQIEAWINQDDSGSVAVFDTTTNRPIAATEQAYTGPVSGLKEQYINITSDSLNISVDTPNWFIHSGSGNDAIAVNSGVNVLDGGTGSNFLTGGSGNDTFFVDDRGPTADIWTTVNNFHPGDAATIWGVTPQDFGLNWVDGQGASGFTGLTLHATESGKPTASLTLAGYSTADLNNGRLSVSFGTVGGSTYMYVHGNS
jgi:V8-like Glu-specific endopeptidase